MEETNGKEDLHGNILRLSTLRTGGSLKSTLSGRSTPRGSPSYRRLRTPRRESKGIWGKFQWLPGNRLVFWLILITVWAYIGFLVQSKWAHNDHSKAQFVGYKSVRSWKKVEDANPTTIGTSADTATNSSSVDPLILKGNEESGQKNLGVSLVRKGNPISSHQNSTTKKSGRRRERRLRIKNHTQQKVAETDNRGVDVDEGIRRRNTSHGLLVGPFGKTEDRVLGWSADKRKGTCDRKSEFYRVVLSRKFVLIFHELSMTGAPISMMELATELLSCGGSVSVVVLSRKGGLIGELVRRGIKVLKDKGELSYKIAMRADLIVAGSAVCSSWIEQYLSHSTVGSSQIVWWIMENRREYFDRSKHLLNLVKMLTFLSESQSKLWLSWCEEEHIQLKMQPTVVPLSVNDELAFIAGIPSSLNTPSFSVKNMLERRNLLRVAVREEMGLVDNDVLVMSLSSINPTKGQLLLLESVLLVSEQELPFIDLKIKGLMKDKNLPGVAVQDNGNQHQGALLQKVNNDNDLEDVLLQTIDNDTSPTVKKKRRRHSRSSRPLSSGKWRNLLSESKKKNDPALKVLIGSIGSKSNKLPYIKGMLRFLSQHSNLSNSFLWTPATTRVASLYAAADVYVINAQGLGETFGRVTIEAMAFGLPILGTDAGGTREIVEDKVTGLLHPIGQEGIRPLAQNLQFLLSNPSAREQLGKNGRLKVEKMYLKRLMYKKLAEVFVKCIRIK